MIIRYDSDFIKKLKKVNVKARKSFKDAMLIFSKDPYAPQLNNHPLKRDWTDFRSINVTADYRAVYSEIEEDGETIAYFVAIGNHKELYK
ncbi:MAG: type II toxin-antitoxin system mRNA interferase toxin, RelE/StbE family [bacterium]|nr:type II toxin-antitoxin system mRNA interferase toxin, RelE/StbE family [bacterium]